MRPNKKGEGKILQNKGKREASARPREEKLALSLSLAGHLNLDKALKLTLSNLQFFVRNDV